MVSRWASGNAGKHPGHRWKPDDAVGIARALGDIARAVGMTKVARQSGLSRESLYKALSEDGNPSLGTILRVARAVGMRFHVSAA